MCNLLRVFTGIKNHNLRLVLDINDNSWPWITFVTFVYSFINFPRIGIPLSFTIFPTPLVHCTWKGRSICFNIWCLPFNNTVVFEILSFGNMQNWPVHWDRILEFHIFLSGYTTQGILETCLLINQSICMVFQGYSFTSFTSYLFS